MKKIPFIVCPVCGTEYLPSEVYMPDSFFGKQKEIIRKPDGTINFYLGDDPDMGEDFICDNCLTKLHIEANVSFNVTAESKEEFSEEYITPINKPDKLKLEESGLFD